MTRAPNGSNRAREWLALLGLSALSGVLLLLADHPVRLWPLQAVALIPLFAALLRFGSSWRRAALAGLFTGLFNLVPLSILLGFPLAMGAALAAYLSLLWVLLALGARWVLAWPAPWGALAAGGIAVLVEWVDFTVVPVWGTAQCFARVWSVAPPAIQLVELTGMLGLVYVLVATQALAAGLVTTAAGRRRHAIALVALLAVVVGYNALAWHRTADAEVRVAALGWTWDDVDRRTQPLFESTYRPLVERAVADGARVVVSPEVGFELGVADRQWLLPQLAALAREHRVTLAVGYFDKQRNDNRIAFIDRDGQLAAEYAKTHLIPFFETYRAGTGELPLIALEGGDLGGMICQDDNFTDLARGYGRRGAELVAVPTNDWAAVKHYHLDNSIFRAVENRYGVVRAASNGISAIISPRGEVLASVDHFDAGAEVIVATIPLQPGGAPYSAGGDWLAGAALLLLVAGVAVRRRR